MATFGLPALFVAGCGWTGDGALDCVRLSIACEHDADVH